MDTSAERLVETAERLRDREFDDSPTFKPVDSFDSGQEGRDAPTASDGGSRVVARAFFGRDSLPLPDRGPFSEVARYVPSEHRVEFRPDEVEAATLEAAVLTALVDGLESRHFPAFDYAEAPDRRIAEFAARHADELLVAAAHLYDQRLESSESPVRAVARRPELALELEPLADRLDLGGAPGENKQTSETDLRNRLRTFGFRRGLELAAALHRSGGWSGVELLHHFDVLSTADVTRPDRWLRGRGLGTWRWPGAGADDQSVGRVGPGLTAVWLAPDLPSEIGRTVCSGWRSDAYRVRSPESPEGSDSSGTLTLDWAVQWNTPTTARKITKGIQQRLKREHGAGHEGPVRWDVFRRGLTVAAVVRIDGDSSEGSPKDFGLSQTKAQFHARESIPLEYTPGRREMFRRKVERATIEEHTWEDPASQLRVDLGPVQDWTVRSSQTLPLRWFAKRKDGTVLQLSTELTDPLGPPFASEEYRRSLQSRFTTSLQSAEIGALESLEQPVDPTLRFSVTGEKNEETWKIGIWQFRHGDVVATLSLQAPEDAYRAHRKAADEVFSSITPQSPPPAPDDNDSEAESGSIDYEVEEPEE